MTTIAEAFEAGIDAVIADPTINKGAFADAMRAVITSGLSNSETTTYIDAVALEYGLLGIVNDPGTYTKMRNEIANEGEVTAKRLYNSLAVNLNALPEAVPVIEAAELLDLREDRDEVDNAIDRCDALIAAEPAGAVGRLVKEVLRDGKNSLRQHKQALRDQIQNITGDPDN
jgi:uncharacterized membrane protein